MVNVTLCFSAAQALLAAKAGATFVSPFVGRLDDIGEDGMGLIADIVQIFRNYERSGPRCWWPPCAARCTWSTAAKLGAHVATLPPAVLRQLFNHPLTDKGLAAFLADWAKTGQHDRLIGRSAGRSRQRPASVVAAFLRAHPRFWPSTRELYRLLAPPQRVHGEVLADHMAAMLRAERAHASRWPTAPTACWPPGAPRPGWRRGCRRRCWR